MRACALFHNPKDRGAARTHPPRCRLRCVAPRLPGARVRFAASRPVRPSALRGTLVAVGVAGRVWCLAGVAGVALGCGLLCFRGCAVAAFSVVSSRSFVVPRGSSVAPLAAPWWRSLVGSALGAGAVRWRVRASSRAFSGAVVVVGFASASAAAGFAGAWSGWVGFPVAVRRFAGRAGAPVFGVSVPVAVPPALRLALPASLPASASWVSGRA